MKEILLETSQLQTLLMVAKSGGFSRAAAELQVTQSAISQSIKNLEGKVKTKIFNRTGKKVYLTPEGEKLYELAHDILFKMGDVLEEIQDNKNTMSGKIRIGTLNGVGKSWLAHRMLEFSHEHPDVQVQFKLGFHEKLIQDFEKNKLDFLILPQECLPHSGEKLLLMEEKSNLVFPKNNNFGVNEKMTLEQFAQLPFILFEENDPLLIQWSRGHFHESPKKIKARFTINSHGFMMHAVAKGMGVAVVPDHVWKRSSQKENLQTLGAHFEVAHSKLYLVYHKSNTDSLRIRNTLSMLTNIKSNTIH